MIDPYWFQKKWGTHEQKPIDTLFEKIEELESRIKVLEEENVETTNELYRLQNSLDSRIDILVEHLETK
jgi:archaellum component FlaC